MSIYYQHVFYRYSLLLVYVVNSTSFLSVYRSAYILLAHIWLYGMSIACRMHVYNITYSISYKSVVHNVSIASIMDMSICCIMVWVFMCTSEAYVLYCINLDIWLNMLNTRSRCRNTSISHKSIAAPSVMLNLMVSSIIA